MAMVFCIFFLNLFHLEVVYFVVFIYKAAKLLVIDVLGNGKLFSYGTLAHLALGLLKLSLLCSCSTFSARILMSSVKSSMYCTFECVGCVCDFFIVCITSWFSSSCSFSKLSCRLDVNIDLFLRCFGRCGTFESAFSIFFVVLPSRWFNKNWDDLFDMAWTLLYEAILRTFSIAEYFSTVLLTFFLLQDFLPLLDLLSFL